MGNVYSVVVRKNVDAIIDPDMLFVKEIVTQAFTDLGNFMVGREEGGRIGFTATFAFNGSRTAATPIRPIHDRADRAPVTILSNADAVCCPPPAARSRLGIAPARRKSSIAAI